MKIYIPSYLKHLEMRLNLRKEYNRFGRCERDIKTKPNSVRLFSHENQRHRPCRCDSRQRRRRQNLFPKNKI